MRETSPPAAGQPIPRRRVRRCFVVAPARVVASLTGSLLTWLCRSPGPSTALHAHPRSEARESRGMVGLQHCWPLGCCRPLAPRGASTLVEMTSYAQYTHLGLSNSPVMMPRHLLLLACSAAAPRAAALVAPRPRVVARPATSLPPPPPRRPSLATERRRPLLLSEADRRRREVHAL